MLNREIFYDKNKLNKNKLKENWIKNHHNIDYLKILDFTEHLNLNKFSQKVYHYLYQLDSMPKCVYCYGEHDRFISFGNGYNKCCSKSCASKFSSKQGIEQRKKNTFKKYGVEHTTQLDDVKNKMKKTNLEKYNVEYASQCEKIKNKQVKTFQSKYGVSYPLQNKIIFSKMKNTVQEKYGVENIIQNGKIIGKINKSNLKKYGNKWHIACEEIKKKISLIRTNKRLIELKEQYPELNILSLKNNFISINCDKCNKKYEISTSLLYLRKQRYNSESCLLCNPLKNVNSSYERELFKILSGYGIKLTTNNRKIITPFEIDLYSEEFKIAIEINGLYWHSEHFKDKNYHLNKTKLCNEKGIHLIHIWEDDWLYKKDIILSKILNIFKLSKNKIYARKTEIKEVSGKCVRDFLKENHLQGYVPSSINLALYYNKEIVSLMTFGKIRNFINKSDDVELLRFCNKLNSTVVGSASKLFKYFIKNHHYNKIISYAKRDWTVKDKNLYKILNFEFEKYTIPNYYWFKDTLKYHRYNFSKDKLISEGYDKNSTEVEIMNSRNYYRIYDSGNLKFIFQ